MMPANQTAGPTLRGIFMRNLAVLDPMKSQIPRRRSILKNADSILATDQTPDHSFGAVWSGPPGPANPSTLSLALDAWIAAMPLASDRSAR